MAAIRHPFSQTNIGDGLTLDVFYTYDDVTLKISSFDWINPGPPTGVTVTVNGVPHHEDVATGPGVWSPGGAGVTLLPGIKGGGPRFPFTVSVAVD